MADAKRVARQWLQTDAAFGVAEAPLGRVNAKREARSATAAVTAAAPVAAVAPMSGRAPVRVASPAAGAPALLPEVVAAKKPMARTKVEVPAAPAGDVGALPVMSRVQKEKAMAELLRELEESSAEYINEISTRVVFGEGDPDAKLMFVGEGPGAEEDRTGRPFVGKSGQLLDKMIVAMGFTRGQVYIGNVVKLRCAEREENGWIRDRPPTPEEAGRGLPFLHRQIEIIRPKVIVTLGAPAVKWLTGTTQGVMKIRGTWLEYRGIPVMPTYHPSFVLRAYTPENRKKVWEDLQMAMARIKEG